jgi:hypothetical protein
MILKQKRAFSLLIAIFTILLLSLIATYIFYASSTVSKSGGLQYQREQSIILARSYTEYAVMVIEANQRTINCTNEIKADIGNPNLGNGYRVIIKIGYIGNQKYINRCSNNIATLSNSDPDTLTAIIDVYVMYKDMNHPDIANANTPWQTYHRRSIQKI